MFKSSAAPLAIKSDTYEQCPNFTFGIVSARRYFKIAREHFAIIWNNDANNEVLLIIKHGKHLHFSAEMIAPSKLTAQKIRWRPHMVRCGPFHKFPIYAIAFLDLT